MSKFKQHLNESVTIGYTSYKISEVKEFIRFWKKLEKECGSFIKEITTQNRYRKVMLRGVFSGAPVVFTRKPRTNRTPNDMPPQWHSAYDKFFNNSFGWKARSEGLFCTGRESLADNYGNSVYIIFPTNNYKYIWSQKIPDLYSETVSDEMIRLVRQTKPDTELSQKWKDEWEDEFHEGSGHGVWYYDGEEVANPSDSKSEAIQSVIEDESENIKNYIADLKNNTNNPEELKQRITELGKQFVDLKNSVESKIEWKPNALLGEWIADKYLSMTENDITEGMRISIINDVCKGKYQDKGLVKALTEDEGNEIMVKCNKYYAIEIGFYDIVYKLLFNDLYDIDQLESVLESALES